MRVGERKMVMMDVASLLPQRRSKQSRFWWIKIDGLLLKSACSGASVVSQECDLHAWKDAVAVGLQRLLCANNGL
jgi:hypothetical protein